MTSADPAPDAPDALARLTAPDQEFEIADGMFVNRRPLRAWLDASEQWGDREYLVRGDERVTFAEHSLRVRRVATALREQYGVAPGDRVAILAANSPDWVTALWAAIASGAVVAAGNAWWTPREATQSLQRAEPAVISTDERRAPLVADLGVPVVEIGTVPVLGRAAPLPELAVDEAAPAVIVYTSGTTGMPKGAVHSHRALSAIIEYHRLMDAIGAATMTAYGLPPRSEPRRFLMSMPLFHIASLHNLAVPRLATGDTIVIDTGAFDADRVLATIERERVTNWAVVPTMAQRVVERAPQYDLSSLTALSINSAPSAPALKHAIRAAIPSVQASVVDTYGLTESGTAATLAGPADLAIAPTSVGRPVPSVEVSVRDAAGAELPDDAEGEIWVRSQFAMSGYWNDPEATANAITPDGWLRTGDIGLLRDGRLFMGARRSDLIIRGGENVYPAEVEAVLDEHADVVEAAVFGVEHPDLGQEVAAVVVTTVSADELRAFLAERLAYYKIPTRWQLRTHPLPRTATGKVVRAGLRLHA